MTQDESERLDELEAKVKKAGKPRDKQHHDMAADVADKTVAASELHQRSMVHQMRLMATSLKWFIVVAIVAFFVIYLLIR